MAKIELPSGFELCKCDDCCPEVDSYVQEAGTQHSKERLFPKQLKPGEKDKCKQNDFDCYCELFYQKSSGDDGDKWHWAYPDKSGKGGEVYRKGKKGEYDYKYFCVKLVFQDKRFLLKKCSCNIIIDEHFGDALDTLKCDEGTENKCSTMCEGNCEVFRLNKDNRASKWEFVEASKRDVPRPSHVDYIYRCLCVKDY